MTYLSYLSNRLILLLRRSAEPNISFFSFSISDIFELISFLCVLAQETKRVEKRIRTANDFIDLYIMILQFSFLDLALLNEESIS
jgi:hypothetical protein